MQEQKQLTKSQQRNATYKRHYACVLTKPEGEILDTILAKYNCKNLSQLCKKIVKEDLILECNLR